MTKTASPAATETGTDWVRVAREIGIALEPSAVERDGPKVLHCSVPFGTEGVRIERTWDTLGLRATGSHTVVLEEVFVPDAAVSLIRPADQWHPVWNVVIGAAMPLILSAYLGIADAAVELARDAVAGRPAPHTFQLLGEMINAHTTAADVVAATYLDADDLRFPNTDELASRTLVRKTVATGGRPPSPGGWRWASVRWSERPHPQRP